MENIENELIRLELMAWSFVQYFIEMEKRK